MEKRAIIAFVLSILVIVGWELFLAPDRKPTQPPEQSVPAEPGPTAPSTTPSSPPPQSIAPESLPLQRKLPETAESEGWTVDTPLYQARLTESGARLEHFRLKHYRTRVEPDAPLMEMVPTQRSGYLPIALDLLHHPDYQLSTRPYTSSAPRRVLLDPQNPSQNLEYSLEIPQALKVTKVLSFAADGYVVQLEVGLKNLGPDPLEDQLGVSFFYQPYGQASESSYNPSQLTVYQNRKAENFNHKAIEKKQPVFDAPLAWLGYQDNYFLQALAPTTDTGYQIIPRTLDPASGMIQAVWLSAPFKLAGGEAKTYQFDLYLGPKESSALKQAGHSLEAAVDFGWFTFLATPLLQLLKWLYKYSHNYGVAIILLTIMIKILFWPLTHKSYKSMQGMKKLQPKMAQIKEKYKDDREKLNQELMMLYRTYKVNPMGGCLPMALQIPVFFALYRMLYSAIEIRHQPFWLWMNDLTAPDRLSIGFNIPYLGGLPVLTLLMGASMFIQQKMTPTTGDPRQEKMMLMMPVIFTVFFINFPAGLVLYWLVNNVLSIVQQYLINRQAT